MVPVIGKCLVNNGKGRDLSRVNLRLHKLNVYICMLAVGKKCSQDNNVLRYIIIQSIQAWLFFIGES